MYKNLISSVYTANKYRPRYKESSNPISSFVRVDWTCYLVSTLYCMMSLTEFNNLICSRDCYENVKNKIKMDNSEKTDDEISKILSNTMFSHYKCIVNTFFAKPAIIIPLKICKKLYEYGRELNNNVIEKLGVTERDIVKLESNKDKSHDELKKLKELKEEKEKNESYVNEYLLCNGFFNDAHYVFDYIYYMLIKETSTWENKSRFKFTTEDEGKSKFFNSYISSLDEKKRVTGFNLNSPIVELFHSCTVVENHCMRCGFESTLFEFVRLETFFVYLNVNFNKLNISIPFSNLYDCLDNIYSSRIKQTTCKNCIKEGKSYINATKMKKSIVKLPKILIFDNYRTENKIQINETIDLLTTGNSDIPVNEKYGMDIRIDIPEKLDLARYTHKYCINEKTTYSLRTLLIFIPSYKHYVAKIKVNNIWYYCDDDIINVTYYQPKERGVIRMLFYVLDE